MKQVQIIIKIFKKLKKSYTSEYNHKNCVVPEMSSWKWKTSFQYRFSQRKNKLKQSNQNFLLHLLVTDILCKTVTCQTDQDSWVNTQLLRWIKLRFKYVNYIMVISFFSEVPKSINVVKPPCKARKGIL